MRRRLLAVLLAISLGGLAAGGPVRVVTGAGQEPVPGEASICAGEPAVGAESAAPAWLASEQPAPVVLLAEAVVDRLPDGQSLLHVSHIALPPDWSGPTRSATGPFLLMTRTGTVTLFIDGVPAIVAAGESASVQSGQLYAVANETGQPATAMRLSVLPPGDDGIRVAEFMPALPTNPDLEPNRQAGFTPAPTNGPETISPVVSQLVRATLAAVPSPPARLFLACLAWEQTSDGGELHQHPGPVGVWVERGALAIGEERTLPRQGCTVFVAGETHQTAAAEPATAALLFGLIPEAEPLWQPAAAASTIDPLDEVTCGDAPTE